MVSVCATRGSTNVYRAMWVGINDGDVTEELAHPHYCGDCWSECETIDADEYDRRQAGPWIEGDRAWGGADL